MKILAAFHDAFAAKTVTGKCIAAANEETDDFAIRPSLHLQHHKVMLIIGRFDVL